MKIFLAFVIFLHGAINVLGFLKAYKLAKVDQLNVEISRFSAAIWLITFVLFVTAGIAFLFKANGWYFIAFIAVILSSILILSAWKDAKFGMLPNVMILLLSISGYATSSFSQRYEKDVMTGLHRTGSDRESVLTESDIQVLPEPVKKYIRYTGSVGKPKVHNFKIEFTGKIRKNGQSDWMPFTTQQFNFLDNPTRLFFMKAVMKHLPVAGYHYYGNGETFMDVRLFSLFKVQYQSGKEMEIAETVTFFNDMCCMAPATLIDNRIQWLETDSNRVKAAFTSNGITVNADLFFNDQGQLTNFISTDRFAISEGNEMKKIQWSTPVKDYKEINGSMHPGYAEAVYSYPEGDFCYGFFSLTNIEYNCKVL